MLVSSCASVPDKTETVRTKPIQSSEIPKTKASSLDAIENQFYTSNLAYSDRIHTRNNELIDLAENYRQLNDCVSAQIILAHLSEQELSTEAALKSAVIKSECIFAQNSQLTSRELQTIESWLSKHQSSTNNDWTIRHMDLMAKVYTSEGRFSEALEMLIKHNQLIRYLQDPTLLDFTWQWFTSSSAAQRKNLLGLSSQLRGHETLLSIIQDQSTNDIGRKKSIELWLNQNPTSIIARYLPTQISQYLTFADHAKRKTALLLPLSGRLASQGLAIKQGVLTAYLQHTSISDEQIELTFIDTGSESQINEEIDSLKLQEFDTIIGPLLKSHIKQVEISPDQKLITLNQNTDADNISKSLVHTTFVLSPEQEAQQLALKMYDSEINKPIVIYGKASNASRMANAFIEKWQSLTSKTNPVEQNALSNLRTVNYDDNRSMRIGIRSALDVLQSQRRIQQLRNISSEEVHSVTRNRRDVDAFVVFARPDELELINPIIESSISLFTETKIPVYASSYSYDHKQNKNTQRDLRNVTFIDMPWVLPEGRSNDLSTTVDELFNQPSSAFLRLFAFGFDALALSDNLVQLSIFKHMNIEGLTGVLSIDAQDTVFRQMSAIEISDDEKSD